MPHAEEETRGFKISGIPCGKLASVNWPGKAHRQVFHSLSNLIKTRMGFCSRRPRGKGKRRGVPGRFRLKNRKALGRPSDGVPMGDAGTLHGAHDLGF